MFSFSIPLLMVSHSAFNTGAGGGRLRWVNGVLQRAGSHHGTSGMRDMIGWPVGTVTKRLAWAYFWQKSGG